MTSWKATAAIAAALVLVAPMGRAAEDTSSAQGQVPGQAAQPGSGAPAAGQGAPAAGAPPAAAQGGAAPGATQPGGTQGGAAPGATQPGGAEGGQAQDEERRKLEEQIKKELGAAPATGAAAQPPVPGTSATAQAAGAPPSGGASAYARLLLLPDISAIGSFSAAYDSYDAGTLSPRSGPVSPPHKLQFAFDEVELGLQSVIDPYARADIFISFHPGGVDVEEAYLTTLSLPAGLQVRAGQFFSPFGRINQLHPHVWEFIDAPLALNRIVAAENLSGPGVDLAWLTPLPWFTELHFAAQSTAPYPGDTQRLTLLTRLLQYFQAGEATTVGVGLSAAARDEGGGGRRDLGVADVYVRFRPVSTRGWLLFQGELYGRRFVDTAGGSAAGGYAQVFWRADPYFGYGVRYDDAPAVPDNESGRERRYTALASWYASEFQRVRFQLAWDHRPGDQNGLEALVGLEFIIGAHGAHPF
jgi:hypothetical protein